MSKLWTCPFQIVVDSNEGTPWSFRNVKVLGKRALIQLETKPLWSMERRDVVDSVGGIHHIGLADYSISGLEKKIQIERKSLSDLVSTVTSRFRRFEAEIFRLHEDCDYSAVIVESSLRSLRAWTGPGRHPKSIEGTIRAWRQRYPRCHWFMMQSRSQAEEKAFEILHRFWNDFEAKKLPSMR